MPLDTFLVTASAPVVVAAGPDTPLLVLPLGAGGLRCKIDWCVQVIIPAASTATVHITLQQTGVTIPVTEQAAGGVASTNHSISGTWISPAGEDDATLLVRRSGGGADPTVTARILAAVDIENNTEGPQGDPGLPGAASPPDTLRAAVLAALINR